MRGEERRQRAMLVVFDPLRRIKELVDAVLAGTFTAVRSDVQRGRTAVDSA